MQGPMHAEASTAPETERSDPQFREMATEVISTARRQLAELLALFTLEIRYSGLMLGSAAALALIAALAMFSVWSLLLAATTAWLLGAGWGWAEILATLALVNAIVLFGALWLMRRSLSRIGIGSTQQALGLGESHASE